MELYLAYVVTDVIRTEPWLALVLHVREFTGSNIGPDTG